MARRWTPLVLAVSACTYVSQGDFEAERAKLDEDGDGVPWAQDCADQDPARKPDSPEIPYDGIDNDCGRDGDVVDLDGDGFPGIDQAAYEAQDPQEPFPDALVGKPVDCVDDPAVFADAGSIHPAPNENEVAYDGVDSDCDGSNDFDVDGDGWMPATAIVDGASVDIAAAFDAYVTRWGYEDRLAGWAPAGATAPSVGDCDDFEEGVHPEPDLPDAWYDGVDQDCDGRNDFDQDGDGWMPPALPGGGDIRAAFEQFVAFYYDGVSPFPDPGLVTFPDGTVADAFSDCLDELRTDIVDLDDGQPADPADVHPRATADGDDWYDGVDTNCQADNDFDQDGDGFDPDGTEDAYAAYVEAWGYEGRESAWGSPNGLSAPGTGDCDDQDDATYPAALERLDDGRDQDCDGLTDAAAFTFADYEWDRPSAPRIVRVGDTWVFGLTSRWMQVSGGAMPTIWEEVGVTLSVKLADARTGVVPLASQFKNDDPTKPVEPVIDAAVVPTAIDLSNDGLPDPAAWFGTIYTADSNRFTYLHGRQVYENSASGALSSGITILNWRTTSYTPGSVQLAVDAAGEPWMLGCGDDASDASDMLHVIQGRAAQPTVPELEDTSADLGALCFFEADPYDVAPDQALDFTRCTGSQCAAYTLSLSSGTLSVAAAGGTGERWRAGELHDGLQILLDDGPGVTIRDAGGDRVAFDADDVLAADAVQVGERLYVAAVIDGPTPMVQLAYGVWPALATIDFPYQHPRFPSAAPAKVALSADGDRVVLVVVGEDPDPLASYSDTVGWAILGP